MSLDELAGLADRFAAVYTGAITDVLDRRGLLHQTLPPEIAPLRPGMRLAGPAYPVEGRSHPVHARSGTGRAGTSAGFPRRRRQSRRLRSLPAPSSLRRGSPPSSLRLHDYDTSIRKILEMLGSVPAGHIAVYQTNDRECSQLGELSVTSLKARGCAGAVLDGGCRDVDFILREDFPVFARYTTPQDSVPRWELLAHGDVTVVIGGVRIAPGDWVVADWDGIVVVPGVVLIEVLEEAEAKAAVESEIRSAVRDGVLPLEAYDRYGTF